MPPRGLVGPDHNGILKDVTATFTAADLEGTCRPLVVHLTTRGAISPPRPILAVNRVRFVGELIGACVADSRYEVADLVEQASPDIDPLPAVVTFEDALGGAGLVHDGVPGNVYFLGRRTYGDLEGAFRRADVVVEGEVSHPRVAAVPIETRGVVASPAREGVEVWTSTQVLHGRRGDLSASICLATGCGRDHRRRQRLRRQAQVYPEEILARGSHAAFRPR
jgi:CO/xanthine dehydrogenase Mo-binding subunit